MKNLLFVLLALFFVQDSIISQSKDHPYESYYDALEWRHIGPFRGGRSCAVTGVPNKPLLYYFGSTGGGVWKTTDGGQSYSNISDGYFGGSIGSIDVSKSDPNVIYVGGGEKTVRGNVSYGYGVWKTVNGGKSWTQMGLEKSRHIPRIKVHPENSNIVFAAVLGDLFKPTSERGIFKSTDGGNSWKKVLFANENAGAVDLIIDPNNPRILYASTWNVRRTPYSLSSGGEGSSLWKSTDSGETWTEIKGNKGLPEGTWGISGVTVSPVNSDRIWAIIENEKGGVYRSDDGGESWKLINSERKLRQRAWYYTRIYADSQDENIVYVLNVRYHRSTDGGNTYKTYNAPHGDHHDLWIAPEDNQRMIIGDDGGAQVSYDAGDNWSTYHNQATAQFYRVTTDDHFPYRIYVAQQDNSTLRIAHRNNSFAITESDWESTAGGESAHIAIDPSNNDIVYGGSYDGFLTRKDHSTGLTRAVNVWPDNPMGHGAEGMKYRFQWNFPIIFSKHNPQKLYALSNHVHVSEDEGQSWKILSPDLTRNEPSKLGSSGGPITQDNTSVEYYCTLFAISESPTTSGTFWVGSDDGLVHLTTDDGENWTNVTPQKLPEWTQINGIEADPHNEGGCYLAATAYKNGDYTPYLFKTENYGKTWTKITNRIPSEHFTRAIKVDPMQKGMLYAGTESGMYASWDDGQNWYPLQMNLPIVPITDLALKNDNLIAATQGRSIWLLDDLSVIRNSNNIDGRKAHLFKPLDAYRMRGGQSKDVKGAGVNHPSGAMCFYHLPQIKEEDEIKLSFLTLQGDTLSSFSNKEENEKYKLEPKVGSNFFNWNMKMEDAEKFDGMILWWGSLNGPKILPGTYKVNLSINDSSQEQEFEVLKDPRSETDEAGLQEQFDFICAINDKVSEAHLAIKEMRSIKDQMNGLLDMQKDTVLEKSFTQVIGKLDSLEKLLYQTKNQSRQDPLNFPIRLTNKLAHINSLVQIGDYPPTESMITVKEELTAAIDEVLFEFSKVRATELPEINALIKDRVTDFIKVKETSKP